MMHVHPPVHQPIGCGVRGCGTILRVPGVMHVATRFECAAYLPFIPFGGVVVVEDEDGNARAVFRTRWYWRSVVVALARRWGCCLAILCLIIGLIVVDAAKNPTDRKIAMVMLGAAPALLAAGLASCRIRSLNRTTYDQALRIADRAELPQEILVRIDMHFGRIPAEDGLALIEQLRREGDGEEHWPARPNCLSCLHAPEQEE